MECANMRCPMCPKYEDCDSHRESEIHQNAVCIKLSEMESHYLGMMKKPLVVHDEEWENRTEAHFCYFCLGSHFEHHREHGLIIENLGCVYHHADSQHCASVKSFLNRNFRTEEPQKYYVSKTNLDSFLEKLPAAKKSYFKEMEKLNDLAQPSCSYAVESPAYSSDPMGDALCSCKFKDPALDEPALEKLVLDDPSDVTIVKDTAPKIPVFKHPALEVAELSNIELENPAYKELFKRLNEKFLQGLFHPK